MAADILLETPIMFTKLNQDDCYGSKETRCYLETDSNYLHVITIELRDTKHLMR